MSPLRLADITQYVEAHIGQFHQKRIETLRKLKLDNVLKRKNPYLFKAKNMVSSEQIIRELSNSFISSNEETLFGDWLEGLAIFINGKTLGGWKSGVEGIDLEFDRDGIRNIITIKSGPNWGNSNQIKKMRSDFINAGRTLRTSNSKIQIKAINGCCYGKNSNPDKGDYFKYCGQQFWAYISDNHDLYQDLIEPLGFQAKQKNDEFYEVYAGLINLFTLQFSQNYCHADGTINWPKIVKLNSGNSNLDR
jgi:hypothetical protein